MKQLIGIVIIVIGLVFLLDNLNVIDHELDNLFALWPLIIVVLGIKAALSGLVTAIKGFAIRRIAFGKLIFGLIVIGVGMSFLSRTTGVFEFPMSELWSWTWPVLVIYIGFKLLFDRYNWTHFHLSGDDFVFDKDFKEHFQRDQMVGDINWGKHPWKVGNKKLNVGVGDTDIDFTTAILEPGENVFELKGWVGSVEMLVPKDMPIHIETSVKVGDMTIFDDNYTGTGRSLTYTSPDYLDAERKLKIRVAWKP